MKKELETRDDEKLTLTKTTLVHLTAQTGLKAGLVHVYTAGGSSAIRCGGCRCM